MMDLSHQFSCNIVDADSTFSRKVSKLISYLILMEFLMQIGENRTGSSFLTIQMNMKIHRQAGFSGLTTQVVMLLSLYAVANHRLMTQLLYLSKNRS